MNLPTLAGLVVATMLIMPIGGTVQAEDDAKCDSPVLCHTVKSIDGKDVSLCDYRGKVVLFVNVASKCGYTRQYKTLQQLHDKYADQGLVILGFPCNQFGKQEPGSDSEIKQFCESRFGVEFPMFSKVDVNGDNASPVYQYLTSDNLPVADKGPVKWNFEKFLVGRDGQVIARFRSKAEPDGEQMIQAIEKALAAKG